MAEGLGFEPSHNDFRDRRATFTLALSVYKFSYSSVRNAKRLSALSRKEIIMDEWCSRPESNRYAFYGKGFSYYSMSPQPRERVVVWTMSSPCANAFRWLVYSLYTFIAFWRIQLGVISVRLSPNQPTFTQEVSYLGALLPLQMFYIIIFNQSSCSSIISARRSQIKQN